MPNRINLDDTGKDVLVKLSQGNPGALRVLCEWITDGPGIDPDAIDPVLQMCGLDDLDIVGSQIWVLYKDVCGQSLPRFLGLLRAHHFGLLPTAHLKAAAAGAHEPPLDALLLAVQEQLPNSRFVEAQSVPK